MRWRYDPPGWPLLSDFWEESSVGALFSAAETSLEYGVSAELSLRKGKRRERSTFQYLHR